VAEWVICGKEEITRHLPGYEIISLGMELLAIHKADPALAQLQLVGSMSVIQ
jgi:hypothetical protein